MIDENEMKILETQCDLNCCIEKINKKVQEIVTSMLIKGEALEESKETVGNLLGRAKDLIEIIYFLYGQNIEKFEIKEEKQ